MSREILPLQRESGVATSATCSKTMLVRFNHVTGLVVNSFAPNHLNIPISCNATRTELPGCPSPTLGVGANTQGHRSLDKRGASSPTPPALCHRAHPCGRSNQ